MVPQWLKQDKEYSGCSPSRNTATSPILMSGICNGPVDSCVVRNCLGATTLATVGRYGAAAGAATQVLYEVKRFTKLAMPDETGFLYPAVYPGGSMQLNNRRRDAYIMRNWADAIAGVQEMVVEVNPTTVFTPA